MRENFKISISKEQISTLPIASFQGEITVVDTPENVGSAVQLLEREKLIGFDTETKPSFKKGHTNKVALMQLSTVDHCFLFRLNRLGMGDEISNLMENESITKIGLSIHDDFNVMHRSSHVMPRGFVELQSLVKDYHIEDISLQKIYAIIFGEKISKGQRLTNWEAESLSPQQQRYAATDAWACLRIYNFLKSGQFHPEASPYIIPESDTTEN
ncbi:MAG: 3'-5' exonuclease domain-containing protein 2 [Muribaculaceae bacterium]|nr:3'-5' exonuclease domain-containing protein 2 [Muribaculaceae bacterium]